MPNYNADAGFSTPIPRHWLTESAEAARAAVRSFASKRRSDRFVTGGFQRPAFERIEHPMPANARKLVELAKARGFEEVGVVHGYWRMNADKVNERKAPAVVVGTIDRKRGIGFRCVWADGKAALGTWYDATPGAHRVEHPGVTEVMARVMAMPDA